MPKKKQTPDDAAARAKRMLKRHAPRNVRYLTQLTKVAAEDAAPCPTCRRGMPRAEELRLRAITTALDKAGIVSPKADAGEDTHFSLVFPAGTRLNLSVESPPAPVETTAIRIDR